MEAINYDKNSRSLVKAISYRTIGVVGTMIIAFIFTGQPFVSMGIAITDFLVGLIFYYVHERIWNFIKWGK